MPAPRDEQIALEFLKLKYEALLEELGITEDVKTASISVVQDVAERVARHIPPKDAVDVKENVRELQGLVLEYIDWRQCTDEERVMILMHRFRYLMIAVGKAKADVKEVALFEIERLLQERMARWSPWHHRLLCTISKELEGWRALRCDRDAAACQRATFWSKLIVAPSRSSRTLTVRKRSREDSRTSSTSSESKVAPSAASTERNNEAVASQADCAHAPELCQRAPHCRDFESKHPLRSNKKKKGVAPQRRDEYCFLYAAQAHCLQCLRYYAALENFNVLCFSNSKTAREWAMTDENDELTVLIPDHVEQWLVSQKL
eukprot:s2112_g11.t1